MNTQEVLRLIADQIDAGQDPCELWDVYDGQWMRPANAIHFIKRAYTNNVRLKQPTTHMTHMVHGVECPAPMSEAPEDCSRYYVIHLGKPGFVRPNAWSGDSIDRNLLENNAAFRTEADALANAKALYPGLFEGDLND